MIQGETRASQGETDSRIRSDQEEALCQGSFRSGECDLGVGTTEPCFRLVGTRSLVA